MKLRIWLVAVPLHVLGAVMGFAEEDHDALVEYDQHQEAAWRERFEEELLLHGVEAAAGEKEAAFATYLARVKERAEQQKSLVEGGNKALVLHGLVMDQDGSPVVDALVSALAHEERVVGIDFFRIQTIMRDVHDRTDAAGHVTLDGGHGRWISVQTISATGYQFTAGQQAANEFYADADVAALKPSARNVGDGRAVFTMWKQQGTLDKLVVQESTFRVPRDGKKHLFSLFRPRGKNVLVPVDDPQSPLDGDILFSVMVGEQDGVVQLRMEVVDGGFTVQDTAGFIAPADGYVSSHDLDISAGDQQQTVFVRSRNGLVYTRLTLNAWYDHERQTAAIDVRYAANPHGRPNLQPGGEMYPSHLVKDLAKEYPTTPSLDAEAHDIDAGSGR